MLVALLLRGRGSWFRRYRNEILRLVDYVTEIAAVNQAGRVACLSALSHVHMENGFGSGKRLLRQKSS